MGRAQIPPKFSCLCTGDGRGDLPSRLEWPIARMLPHCRRSCARRGDGPVEKPGQPQNPAMIRTSVPCGWCPERRSYAPVLHQFGQLRAVPRLPGSAPWPFSHSPSPKEWLLLVPGSSHAILIVSEHAPRTGKMPAVALRGCQGSGPHSHIVICEPRQLFGSLEAHQHRLATCTARPAPGGASFHSC
jgi:hypothetical protein